MTELSPAWTGPAIAVVLVLESGRQYRLSYDAYQLLYDTGVCVTIAGHDEHTEEQ